MELPTYRSPDAGMTDQAKPVSRPWRRFLRFSVRGLIVLMLAMGAGLGWLVRGARIQREAVAAITKAGGTVVYNWNEDTSPFSPAGKPWAPGWLVKFIGVHYFGHVTGVDFYDNASTDAGLVHLKRLNKLSRLHLAGTQLTDAGLVHLHGLTNLSHLDLSYTKVSDDGRAHLKPLKKLSRLDVFGNRVTDAGIKQLRLPARRPRIYY